MRNVLPPASSNSWVKSEPQGDVMNTVRKVALITGANKGLGFETARQLGKQGITVLIGARDEARGKKAAEELSKAGIDAHFIHLDMEQPGTFHKAYEQIEAKYAKLDILVNNA